MSYAGTIGNRLQSSLASSSPVDSLPVIVHFNHELNLSTVPNKMAGLSSKASKAKYVNDRKLLRKEIIELYKSNSSLSKAGIRQLLKQQKVAVNRDLWMINALSLDLTPQMIEQLSALPMVDRIELDREITLASSAPAPVPPGYIPAWNMDMIHVPSIWGMGITGQGITIATMDTGVDGLHPQLASKWRGGTNSWFDAYGVYPQPHDGSSGLFWGHGTASMGIIVGGNTTDKVIGVAPDAQWISAKIFRDDNTATLSGIHAAFQWMLDPDNDPATDDAPDVVNNSWGLPTVGSGACDTEFHNDINLLRSSGIAVIFSAGNDGSLDGSLYSPADYDPTTSVGSIDEFYTIATSSSRGPSNCSTGVFPKLIAPGVDIYTTVKSSGLGDPYNLVTGTSFAAPHIAGVYALIKSGSQQANINEIETAMYTSATDLGSPGTDNVTGYGLVNAYDALLHTRCPLGTVDDDNDGWYNECDNCTLLANPLQTDTDADGYGNRCDSDFNNDGIVNTGDLVLFANGFFTTDALRDINGDGIVNVGDLVLFSGLFFQPPGPSAIIQ